MSDKKRIAIVPGSFDPITNGHVDIIRRASKLYDEVVVAVMINAEKKYLFTLPQRKQIAQAAVVRIPNVRVISSEGMLWKLALELNACAIVKGVRNEMDRAYEERMAEFNTAHNPNAVTVLLDADPSLETVSSTKVRQMLNDQDDISAFLPKEAVDVIYQILFKKEKR